MYTEGFKFEMLYKIKTFAVRRSQSYSVLKYLVVCGLLRFFEYYKVFIY